jgi:Peptidase MA superfamily
MISSPFSAFPNKANLSYAESYSLVDFLIQKYGSEKMSELLQAFKTGNTFDGAFEQVLGFDMDGLNQQWQPWIKTAYGK